ncbi:MAG: hypothetical protein GY832_27245 [Chloroflexi bacterium]|nr:hypothetical protein [Chloroflexota bacterium]
MRRIGLVLCLLLTACTVGIVRQERLTPVTATQTPPSAPTAAPQPTVAPVASATPIPSSTPSPTHQPATPQPSPSSTSVAPVVTDLRAPVIVDSAAGRLYVTGQVDGAQQIVALAATDGRLLDAYNIAGTFAVDTARGKLYVDRDGVGLTVLDTQTGAVLTTIPLPGDNNPAPQADPATGYVFVFRDNVVHDIDPDRGEIVDTIVFDLPHSSCGELTGPSPISWARYDSVRRHLYLSFFTYNCTPWGSSTIVSYDLNLGAEIARQAENLYTAVVSDGYLYGSGMRGLDSYGVPETYFRHAWRDGQPWQLAKDWPDYQVDLCIDPARGWLYESGDDFRIVDAETMVLLTNMPNPVDGQLVGYDPQTDQLYFIAGGQLRTWPVSAIQTPSPAPAQVSPPAEPVQRVWLSPAWPQDRTTFGSWGLNPAQGQLYLSRDGGVTWEQPQQDWEDKFVTLAVSPGYAEDQTVVAGVSDRGILKSKDGGRSWLPANVGIPNTHVSQIFFSPGFEQDSTVFALSETLYRSTDGAVSWHPLDIDLGCVALSPEFDQDQTLIGISTGANDVALSQDRGNTWEYVGSVPGDGTTGQCMINIAPLFSRWQVAFAYIDNALYHSVDGGRSWNTVLELGSPPQLVYGPETEAGRVLFLQATSNDPISPQNILYYSEDAVNWQVVELPPGISPTAIAISPDFAQDGLLFVGNSDGQIVRVNLMALIGE